MLAKLSQYLPFVLIAILLLSQFQRGLTRPGTGSPSAARRTVTMLGAGLVLGMWIAVLFLLRISAPDWTGVLPIAAAAGAVYLLRNKLTAFPTHCQYCGRRLPARITFGIDAGATARYEEGSCPAAGCTGSAPGAPDAAPPDAGSVPPAAGDAPPGEDEPSADSGPSPPA
ncbi:MAG: hypothetical protein OXC12_21570 [Spirochaetaceae bacterium]|nr:hypothetical protein [Spirochaetaceae bacterium]